MKTLWIYGDSFGVDWKVDWGWQRQLTQKLNVDKVVNQACSGSANEWGAKLFKSDQQKKGDIVIFFLTQTARQWFWEDRPYLSNLTSIMNTKDASELKQKEQDKYDAAMSYWLHLQRDDIDQLRFEHMLDSIRVQMIERELHLQVIPSFNLNINWTDLVPCHGSMTFSVGDAEFTADSEMEKWYNESIDTRANHMTLANHLVFADKLYRRFTNNEPINLETEFETGFLKNTDKIKHPGLCPELIELAKQPGNKISFPID
tara:strand:+ start:2536 stop:3312 length:777 start_codon:yes stop_codon:yes gene_type:complete